MPKKVTVAKILGICVLCAISENESIAIRCITAGCKIIHSVRANYSLRLRLIWDLHLRNFSDNGRHYKRLELFRTPNLSIRSVAQWLGRRSVAGGLFLIYAWSMVDIWPLRR